jgi:hypothetical protein
LHPRRGLAMIGQNPENISLLLPSHTRENILAGRLP